MRRAKESIGTISTEVLKTTYCGPSRGGGLASWSLVESEARVVKVRYGNFMWSVPTRPLERGTFLKSPSLRRSGDLSPVLVTAQYKLKQMWGSGGLTP